MNLKNLVMWGVIVFLTIGLYNVFKNPQSAINKNNTIIFSEFLSEVDNGRVVEVQIQGNNIQGNNDIQGNNTNIDNDVIESTNNHIYFYAKIFAIYFLQL